MSASLVPEEFAARGASTVRVGAAAVTAKRVPRTVVVPSSLRKYIFVLSVASGYLNDDFLPVPLSERRRWVLARRFFSILKDNSMIWMQRRDLYTPFWSLRWTSGP